MRTRSLQLYIELFGLLDPKENLDYAKAIAGNIKKMNSEAQLQYAEIISIDDEEGIEYRIPVADL